MYSVYFVQQVYLSNSQITRVLFSSHSRLGRSPKQNLWGTVTSGFYRPDAIPVNQPRFQSNYRKHGLQPAKITHCPTGHMICQLQSWPKGCHTIYAGSAALTPILRWEKATFSFVFMITWKCSVTEIPPKGLPKLPKSSPTCSVLRIHPILL